MAEIGIMTYFAAENYGAVLQAYALQETLRVMGHQAEFVNYRPEYIFKPYKLRCIRQKGLKQYLLGVAGHLSRIPMRKSFARFRENLNISAPYTKAGLGQSESAYDYFLVGSDQVWNYKVNGEDTSYFLDFVQDDSKKFCYSASIGMTDLDEVHTEKFVKYLKKFNNVSVREASAQKLLQERCKIRASWNLDPTLLLGKEGWMKFIDDKFPHRDYILVYQIGMSKQFVTLIEEYAKKMSKKVVVIPFPRGRVAGAKYHIDAGPKEFLNYIYYADEIFTDSFHCTVFSIIFQKKFRVGIFGDKKETGSRITDLLDLCGIEGALLDEKTQQIDETGEMIQGDRKHFEKIRAENRLYLKELFA